MTTNKLIDDIEALIEARSIIAKHRVKYSEDDNQNHVTNLAQTEKQLDWVIDQLKVAHFNVTFVIEPVQ